MMGAVCTAVIFLESTADESDNLGVTLHHARKCHRGLLRRGHRRLRPPPIWRANICVSIIFGQGRVAQV